MWYLVRNTHDLPEHAAKRIEDLLWDGENISVKFDDAASSYKEPARELEEIVRERGLPAQRLGRDARALNTLSRTQALQLRSKSAGPRTVFAAHALEYFFQLGRNWPALNCCTPVWPGAADGVSSTADIKAEA